MFSAAVKKLTRAGTIQSYFPKWISPVRVYIWLNLCTHWLPGLEGRTKSHGEREIKTQWGLSLFLVKGINLHSSIYENPDACREIKQHRKVFKASLQFELHKKSYNFMKIGSLQALKLFPFPRHVVVRFYFTRLRLQSNLLRTIKKNHMVWIW